MRRDGKVSAESAGLPPSLQPPVDPALRKPAAFVGAGPAC